MIQFANRYPVAVTVVLLDLLEPLYDHCMVRTFEEH